MSNNVNWGHTDGETLLLLPPGSTAGDGVCEDDEWGVMVDDIVVYASTREQLRRWAAALTAALTAEQDSTPAVTFDEAAFRTWLDRPFEPKAQDGQANRAVSPYLPANYDRTNGDAGWLLETTLGMLRDAPHVWALGTDVSQVRIWATCGIEDGPDGAIAGEVTVAGIALSLGRLTNHDLIPIDENDTLPGEEAALLALRNLATAINSTVEHASKPTTRVNGLTS